MSRRRRQLLWIVAGIAFGVTVATLIAAVAVVAGLVSLDELG